MSGDERGTQDDLDRAKECRRNPPPSRPTGDEQRQGWRQKIEAEIEQAFEGAGHGSKVEMLLNFVEQISSSGMVAGFCCNAGVNVIASEDADVSEFPVLIALMIGSCWQLCVPFWHRGIEGKMLVPTCGIAYGLKEATLETVRFLYPQGAIVVHLDANVRGFPGVGGSPCMKHESTTLDRLGGCVEFDREDDPDIQACALFATTFVRVLGAKIAIEGTLCVALSRPAKTALDIVSKSLGDEGIAVSMLSKPPRHVSMVTLWEQTVDLNDQVLPLFRDQALGGGVDTPHQAADAVARRYLQGIVTEFKGTRNATIAADLLQVAADQFEGIVSHAAKSGHEGYLELKDQGKVPRGCVWTAIALDISTIHALLEVDKEEARQHLLGIHTLSSAAGGSDLPAPTNELARWATSQQADEAAKMLSRAAGGSDLPAPTNERARSATSQHAVEAAKKLRDQSGRRTGRATPLMASRFPADQKRRMSQLMFKWGM